MQLHKITISYNISLDSFDRDVVDREIKEIVRSTGQEMQLVLLDMDSDSDDSCDSDCYDCMYLTDRVRGMCESLDVFP